MKKIMPLVQFLLISVLFSCNNDNRIIHEISTMIGRRITFPEDYLWIPPHQAQRAEKLGKRVTASIVPMFMCLYPSQVFHH